MIISPPFHKEKTTQETDTAWIGRVMSANAGRSFPVNTQQYDVTGEPLVDIEGKSYEYGLYNTATGLYPQSPGAGFELLRFGRIINTDHETLVPADAPLWRTVNFPGGNGMVNLATADIKKFSDSDFPHWTGWQLVDDDTDINSQCNSAIIQALQDGGHFDEQRNTLICHFPFEWNISTFDTRFAWLKTGSNDIEPMSDADYDNLKAHAAALCFKSKYPETEQLWHFEPTTFIAHFRKCCWLSKAELKQLIPWNSINGTRWESIYYSDAESSAPARLHANINKTLRKYLISTPFRLACFLGNAIQETGWLSTTYEGYRYPDRDPQTKKITGHHNIWYYPWHGRGLLQLTGPANYFNYFSFRGYTYQASIQDRLSAEYDRLYRNSDLRYTDNKLGDAQNADLPTSIIVWRDKVAQSDFEAADSAGFYWYASDMAGYADQEHVLERCSVRTNLGIKVYYRSPALWQASAKVNLPNKIDKLYHRSLNGFEARCCVYGSAVAVLTELKFPDSIYQYVIEKPESNQLRRQG